MRAELALDAAEQGAERPAAVLQELGIEAREVLHELHEGARYGAQLLLDVAEEGGLGVSELAAPVLEMIDEVPREELDAGLFEVLDRGLPLQLEEQGGGRVRDLPGVGRPPGPRQAGGDQAVDRSTGLVQPAPEVGQRLGAERVLGEHGGGDPSLEEGPPRFDDLR